MTPKKKKAFDQLVEDSLAMLSPPERQALEEGMAELGEALSWFFEGEKAHPDTWKKIERLIERRETSIVLTGEVTITRTAACKNIVAPNTVKRRARGLWDNWYNIEYRPPISSISSK